MDTGSKVRYIGDTYKVTLIKGKVYTLLGIDPIYGWLQILDETDDVALFPEYEFELVA